MKDTIHPIRILNTLIRFLINLGEKGEVNVATPPVAWQDSLPDDIKADPVFEKYKDANEAHRALVGAQKFLGRETLPVPKDENDSETQTLILRKLGLPEKEDGYALPTDFEIPKDLPIDETLTNSFRKTAHSLGILPKQFAGLYKWYMTEAVNSFNKMGEDRQVSQAEAETNLRKKYGAAYPQNIALAKKVVSQFADDKAYNELEKGLGNNPALIELFINIGKVLSEDQLIGKPSSTTMTPDEAQSEINKIKGDKNHPYWNEAHPSHTEAVEQMTRLMKLITL